MDDLRSRAEAAGLSLVWTDAFGRRREVGDETLTAALRAIGEGEGGSRASMATGEVGDAPLTAALAAIGEGEGGSRASMTTGVVGRAIAAPAGARSGDAAQVRLESGGVLDVRLVATDHGAALPPIDEPGYHRIAVGSDEFALAVAPPRAFTLRDAIGERDAWGVAVQLYGLPPRPGATFGDLGALAACADALGEAGADALAISPIHALYAADPGRDSPYAPSTRLFLNPLYADPRAVFDDAFAAAADDLGGGGDELIDWPREGAGKLEGLRRLFARFERERPEGMHGAFSRWRLQRGVLLERHATYEALQAHLSAEAGVRGWQGWPEDYRNPDSHEVARFRRERACEVEFHVFLQWLAERSLENAQARARGAGMGVGVVADMAVGMDAGGSHAWSRPGELLQGVSIGAPPDLLGPLGQDWGLTTFSPRALAEKGFAPFIETLRAAMRHVGGVRIDHVMGLARLWLVPWGRPSSEGVYLSYPIDDMLRLVALESWRHRAIVIGEDLGTVPDGFRGKLGAAGVMGMRVLYFERGGDGGFKAPSHYDRDAVAMTTTHDLPTVAGWWRGRDLEWREELSLYPETDHAARAREERAHDRARFWAAARACGAASGEAPDACEPARAVDAGVEYVARSACALAIVPAEDIAGLVEQPNLPGVTEGHPNWRRRLPADRLDSEAARRRLAMLSARRGRGGG